MMMTRRLLGALFVASLLQAGLARDALADRVDFGVSPKTLSLIGILPCPPQSGPNSLGGKSCPAIPALEKSDYMAVLRAQRQASASEKAAAVADAVYPSLAQFGRPIWGDLAHGGRKSCAFPDKAVAAKDDTALSLLLPQTVKLWKDAGVPEQAIVDQAKKTFARSRPYQTEESGLPSVEALVPTDKLAKSPSYPSGHAAFGFASGLLLSKMIPEHQDIVHARAIEYARHRVIVGVHFPTDIEAGETSGILIAGTLLQDEAFQHELEAARRELRAALCY